jgi:predicted dehydrogenase
MDSGTSGLRSTDRSNQPCTVCTSRTSYGWAARGPIWLPVDVPPEYLVPAGSPRDANEGVPATVFRYDLMWEFVSAIVQRRDAVPSFYDGLRAQLVADAVLQSHQQRVWVEIPDEPR